MDRLALFADASLNPFEIATASQAIALSFSSVLSFDFQIVHGRPEGDAPTKPKAKRSQMMSRISS
jgi:hypothetical protein